MERNSSFNHNSDFSFNTPDSPSQEGHVPEVCSRSEDVARMARDIDKTVARQRKGAAENEPEFFPLEVKLPPATPIPREAFGRLEEWAQAVSTLSRAPKEMSLVLTLACVNMAFQALVDIDFLGRRIPINLFFIIIGPSGCGKSSAYSELIKPFDTLLNHLRDEAAADRESGRGSPKFALTPNPYTTDATLAALKRVLSKCRGPLGLVTDEAGCFIGGHAMQSQTQLETVRAC